MRIDSVVVAEDELIIVERGFWGQALQDWHRSKVIHAKRLMKLLAHKRYTIIFIFFGIILLCLSSYQILALLAVGVLGEMSWLEVTLHGLFPAFILLMAVDILRFRHHDSWLSGLMMRASFPFDGLILRKRFQLDTMVGRCLRFTQEGYYAIALKSETEYENAVPIIRAKTCLSVPRKEFKVAEHSPQRITLIAFRKWRHGRLNTYYRSIFLERTTSMEDWGHILEKMEEFGYFSGC